MRRTPSRLSSVKISHMSKRKDAWNTKKNAAGYDAYASKFSLYKETSRDLVEIANITSGMTVVDLAAGTGVTTEAVLEQTDNDVTVIAVDQAEEMLKKARERHSDKGNVTYVVAQAESLEKSISDKVDAVICNSAFWQMVPKPTLQAVSRILKDDGIFAFNLPDSFFAYKEFKNEPRKSVSYSYDDLKSWGEELSMKIESCVVKEYESNAREVVAFNEIPVMQRNFPSEEAKEEFINDTLSKDETRKKDFLEIKRLWKTILNHRNA